MAEFTAGKNMFTAWYKTLDFTNFTVRDKCLKQLRLNFTRGLMQSKGASFSSDG